MRFLRNIRKIRQTPENVAFVIVGSVFLLLAVHKAGYFFGSLLSGLFSN